MKEDIKNRGDIEKLIEVFYGKAMYDPLIGRFFMEVVKVNWAKHLPIMISFWENALFYSGGYSGDPMNVHRHLNRLSTLKKEHYDRWTSLFLETVDELYAGEIAERAKQSALSIATVMQIKIQNPESPSVE